jgi:putative acetyltransferase
MAFSVRSAHTRDRDAILALVEEAFTGPDHDGREEVQVVLDTWRLEATVPELELIAVEGETAVGHILGARGTPGSPSVVAVAPLCVYPTRQRSGVGSALMSELLRRAEHQGWPAVVLLGDPRYYGRFGFESAGDLGVIYEVVGKDDPHFQLRPLRLFDSSIRGTFRYCWEVQDPPD